MSGVVAVLGRVGLWGRGVVVAMPYLWLLLFFLVPFLIVFGISFSESIIAQPPYAPLLGWLRDEEAGTTKLQILLNLTNYLRLGGDDLYILAYLNSVKIALVTTLLCLAIGYPMAYAIARAAPARRGPLMMLVILPFWTSFLIRIYAWIGILKAKGSIDNLAHQIASGINYCIEQINAIIGGFYSFSLLNMDWQIEILYTDWAVYIGMTYCYLPFMVLPLYSTLEKMDPTLLEAAADLGCRPLKAFLSVTLPLSIPGIVAGSLLVFIPAVGEFVTPELLGGPDTLMIGRVLWNEFFANRDWPVASAVAIALLLVLVVPIMIFQYVQGREAERR